MFVNLSPTPFYVKAAVHQSKEPNQAENWAVEARHRLAQHRGKKPETTAGQIWTVWPDSKSALAEGQRIGTILPSTRVVPLSRYEIKAGWEIPAILKQSLKSELPGELKA